MPNKNTTFYTHERFYTSWIEHFTSVLPSQSPVKSSIFQSHGPSRSVDWICQQLFLQPAFKTDIIFPPFRVESFWPTIHAHILSFLRREANPLICCFCLTPLHHFSQHQCDNVFAGSNIYFFFGFPFFFYSVWLQPGFSWHTRIFGRRTTLLAWQNKTPAWNFYYCDFCNLFVSCMMKYTTGSSTPRLCSDLAPLQNVEIVIGRARNPHSFAEVLWSPVWVSKISRVLWSTSHLC